jgi:hypothetical protein
MMMMMLLRSRPRKKIHLDKVFNQAVTSSYIFCLDTPRHASLSPSKRSQPQSSLEHDLGAGSRSTAHPLVDENAIRVVQCER